MRSKADSVQRVGTVRDAVRMLCVAGILLACASAAYCQFTGQVFTDNGPDNNPNQAPSAVGDIVGTHSIYIADSIYLGKTYFLPSYNFVYNSFVHYPVNDYYQHNLELDWNHPDLFMPTSVTLAIKQQREQEIQDSIKEANEEAESGDSVKNNLSIQLQGYAAVLLNADFNDGGDTNAVKTSANATPAAADATLDTTAAEESDTTEEEADTTETDTTAAAADTTKEEADSSEEVESPRDILKDTLAERLSEIAVGFNAAKGSDSTKRAVADSVRNFQRILLAAFPGEQFVKTTNDSLNVFLHALQLYNPGVKPKPPAEDTSAEEDTTIYVALAVPRSTMYQFSQSDLLLETIDIDTASYALTVSAIYNYLYDTSPGDSLGSSSTGVSLQMNQAPAKWFNIYENVQVNTSNYAELDTLNNTETMFSVQTRFQNEHIMGLFEAGYGVKSYSLQEQDTVRKAVVVGKKTKIDTTVAKSATVTSQVTLGLALFWRPFTGTAIGGMFYYLDNPQNNARVALTAYLDHRYGFNDLFNDQFSYQGPDWRLYLKQYLFDKITLGFNFETEGMNYNQAAYALVKKKLTTYLRKDQQKLYELQFYRQFDFEHSFIKEFTTEILVGSLMNTSNDPTFRFHEGYAMLNLMVDF